MWQSTLSAVLLLATLASGNDVAENAIEEAKQSLQTSADRFAQVPNGVPSTAELFSVNRRAPSEAAARQSMAAELFQEAVNSIPQAAAEIPAAIPGAAFAPAAPAVPSSDVLQELLRLSGCDDMTMCNQCKGPFYKRYRTADGTCNNFENPEWGAAVTPFKRLEPADYENGINLPKGWTPGILYNGEVLPSPRLVSLEVIKAVEILEDPNYSQMLMMFGQFLDHDITFTPMVSLTGEGREVSCDGVCENVFPCFPILPPEDDPRIPEGKCISSTRSSAACVGEPFIREQFNAITGYIDSSNVYGSDLTRQQRLRQQSPDLGEMKVGILSEAGKPFLPFDEENPECISPDTPCFIAGDERSNEQPALAAMHTIWMREHNRIAARLRTLNPDSDGESIFQAARKIVGAENQVITFKQWLPKVIGDDGMAIIGPYTGYDPSVDASIFNELATAAFRFGHGLIRPVVERLKEDLTPIPEGNIPLHQSFFAPHVVVNEGGIDPLMRGMFGIALKLQDPNNIVTDEVTERLFELANAIALDLASLNIQRGRDHGLPGYNVYRESCGLTKAGSIAEFAPEIPDDIIAKLEAVYGHPDNVDLWVGGMAETPAPGARVGPTFQCIIAKQFKALRDGDRFWYENPGIFEPAQVSELEKSSLSRVLCDNGDNINIIQPDAFLFAELGEMGPCEALPEVRLDVWDNITPRGFCTCKNIDITTAGGCR